MNSIIALNELLRLARDLKSVHGENPENDRALVELCTEAAGWPMEECPRMSRRLKIQQPDP